MESPLRAAQSNAEQAKNSRAFEVASRAGFVARGVIYALIGALAVKLAVGAGGKATNQKGALQTISHQPFGKLLVLVLAVGFGGYALWRFVQAAYGRGPEGGGGESAFKRISALGSGLAYAALCVTAITILTGSSGSSSSGSPKKATAGVLGWTGGRYLVGIAGLVLLGIAGYQVYRGVTKKFLEDDKTGEMSATERRWITRLGTVGYIARGIVFGLIGIFVTKAAIDFNAKQAIGLDGALRKLLTHGYGPLLLGIVAAGLVAFGLFSISESRYRRI